MSATKQEIIDDLQAKRGPVRRIGSSQSLVSIANGKARVYFRYSKVHPDGRTFYGLRSSDLEHLEGKNSFICFLSDAPTVPVLIPFEEFDEVFHATTPAEDGQYKVQISTREGIRELYIARAGRFNVEGFLGLDRLERSLTNEGSIQVPELTHSQVQTLLANIGHLKGFDVFVPAADCLKLDWSLVGTRFQISGRLPSRFEKVLGVLSEIDVIWARSGSEEIASLFEVEHSTPVYSGLLRFNDVFLVDRALSRFSIVSNDSRRALFTRQLNRPTFVASGLTDRTTFLEYSDVFEWHRRLSNRGGD